MKRVLCFIMIVLTVFQTCIPIAYATDTDTAEETVEEFVPMQLSAFGLEMIKSFEGFDAYPYWDYSQWTVGYGTSCGTDKNTYPSQYENGITEVQATALMLDKMQSYVNAVNKFMKSYEVKLNQNQFDALVSFSYNCGAYAQKMRHIVASSDSLAAAICSSVGLLRLCVR